MGTEPGEVMKGLLAGAAAKTNAGIGSRVQSGREKVGVQEGQHGSATKPGAEKGLRNRAGESRSPYVS